MGQILPRRYRETPAVLVESDYKYDDKIQEYLST
jgi:hypothetical protein